MSKDMDDVLNRFLQKYQEMYTRDGNTLQIEYDSDWLSPCYQQSTTNGENVLWAPTLQHPRGEFNNLNEALELIVNPQLAAYYSLFYADNLMAEASKGKLQLLQAWNQDDFERLQQNLIAHVLMKRKLKQEETLFFALTDQEDFILSVHNASGNVVLEQVGKPHHEVIADDLCQFIESLAPTYV